MYFLPSGSVPALCAITDETCMDIQYVLNKQSVQGHAKRKEVKLNVRETHVELSLPYKQTILCKRQKTEAGLSSK